MNQNARRWVNALRSGRYKQIRGSLRNSYGYCALGVLYKEYYDANNVRWQDRVYDCGSTYQGRVMEWVGMDSITCLHLPNGDSIVTLNDDGHRTFSEIADAIETYSDYLFYNVESEPEPKPEPEPEPEPEPTPEKELVLV